MPGKYDNAFPNAQKVQIFEQVDTYIENHPAETSETALLAIIQIIQALEQRHTPIDCPEAAIEIIDAEFKELKSSQPLQWQNLLSVKRLYNGGKKASLKLGEHFAEENPWGKGLVAFLEGFSEDVK
ncbi:MAG: hypothetical protein HC860_21865 [Alkalinema sp. RU_4_3]|nr:hypothetical protein [Alkalinema sp. RU_4_3]